MKEYLIVDGYNVLFGWQKLKKIAQESLEDGRQLLQDLLVNYGTYRGFDEVILVFDGNKSKESGSIIKVNDHFTTVYTTFGQTADSYIEKAVFERKGKLVTIYVVTSDEAEQYQVLGSGGLRIPVRELTNLIEQSKKSEVEFQHILEQKGRRNNLANLISDEHIMKVLEDMRLNKIKTDKKPS